MGELPTGTVTFLFTDIEGSTNLARTLGERWPDVLEQHHDILRRAIRDAGGIDVRTEGDAFFAVFRSPIDAVRATTEAQREVNAHQWPPDGPIRVRMGLHTGEGRLAGDDYVGLDVHRAARIAAAASGGQVLLSNATKTLVAEADADGWTLRDLGKHRFKDFDAPQPIFQLVIDGLPAEFPAIKSLEIPTNLPVELTSFVGRDSEVSGVRDLLGSHRLVTLTGPGGTGKTRLSLETAGQVAGEFPDGAFFVELASIGAPDLVPSTIARTLGLREEGSRPVVETLSGHVRDREMLLVLDNFEHVLEAAPIVTTLLAEAPKLRVVVTSRAPLRIRGEQEFPVPPLELPRAKERLDPEDAGRYAAVALFAERAAEVDPAFQLTAENAGAVAAICARLDGLPLAIELAASRVKFLAPEQMRQRLDRALPMLSGGPRDLPDRQRTLRGAIAWSHDLLDEADRTLFRRLSVFAGGWTLDEAEAVAVDGDVDVDVDALSGLAALVDRSLIHREESPTGDPRFDMLSTIREFGQERLEELGEATTIRLRHASHLLSLAEDAEPHLRSMDQKRWLDMLETEHDNLRAALAWAVEADEGEIAMRFIAALWRFWHLHGHLEEGRRWAEAVLALPSAAGRTRARAEALGGAGSLAYWQFDILAIAGAYEEAFSIAQELGDPALLSHASYNYLFIPALQGDFDTALERLMNARRAFEEVGDQRGVGDTFWVESLIARLAGDMAKSRQLAEQGLRIEREVRDRFGVLDALHMYGRASFGLGDLETLRESFLETIEAHEEIGNRTGIAIALDNLAAYEIARERPERAVRMAGASSRIKEEAGGAAPPEFVGLPDPREVTRDSLSEDAITAAWEEGRAMGLSEAVAYARREAE
ncbi:MAG TPA: adenylate/guanylate cyclase domain-containing protein [Actinomycetota bacterium]